MNTRVTLRSLLIVVAIVAIGLAYSRWGGKRVIHVHGTSDGKVIVLYTRSSLFCDKSMPVYCSIAAQDDVLVAETVACRVSCGTALAQSDFSVIDDAQWDITFVVAHFQRDGIGSQADHVIVAYRRGTHELYTRDQGGAESLVRLFPDG